MSEDREDGGKEGPHLPNVEDIRHEIRIKGNVTRKKEDVFLRAFAKRSIESDRSYAHLKGLQDHYWHKSMWSIVIALLMGAMIGFQSILLGLVGAGIWSFEKYTWLLPALLVQNFAQIIGLALFVVKALFKEMSPD